MSGKVTSMKGRPVRNCRKSYFSSQIAKAKKIKENECQVKAILKKEPEDRSSAEQRVLTKNKNVLKILEKRAQSREVLRQKSQEMEDSAEDLERKVAELARVINHAEHLVVYTGAGISTAASIPDYRGPNGVWTLLQQGKGNTIQNNSLVDAEPTLTHMALARLVQEGKVKHIVSQNCDGLHLRSGLPPDNLSELHGNMYIEVCMECEPERQYIRLFDVTEQTSLRRHRTSRRCLQCGETLRDTIVHFGEKGVVEKPLNWAGAVGAAEEADAILCLGSSLKVLRRYQCLWNTDRPKRLRPLLYIVNLQWTSKDSQASLKIHGRCDDVLGLVMKQLDLQIPTYAKNRDPIFKLATQLEAHEECSYSTKMLSLKQSGCEPASDPCPLGGKKEHTIKSFIKVEEKIKAMEKSDSEDDQQRCQGGDSDAQVESNHGNVPGWYGKGYRKRVIKRVGRRRRSRVSSAESGT